MLNITSVRITLKHHPKDRTLAEANIIIDRSFLIKGFAVIDGTRGLFVSMPRERLMDICPECGKDNHLRAIFCNECGFELEEAAVEVHNGKEVYFEDMCHPCNQETRQQINEVILSAYEREKEARLQQMKVVRV